MKKEFLTFVIGVLIGAIIATGVFLVLELNDNDSSNIETSMEAPSGEMGEMGDGDFDPNSVGGERQDEEDSNETSNNSTDDDDEDEDDD